MAQRFDVTFKHLFRHSRGVLARMLFGDAVEWLNIELPEVRNLRPDLLARTADGEIRHTEVQSDSDPNLPLRMLEYCVALLKIYRGLRIVQTLLYIGRAPLRFIPVFETPDLYFRFNVVNLREMDGAELLASDDWADNEFALLTQSDRETVIRKVLAKLRTLTGEEQETATSTFVIIGGILGIEDQLQRRIKSDMIDLMENKVIGPAIRQGLRQGLEQGRQEGRQEGHREGLEQGLTKGRQEGRQEGRAEGAAQAIRQIAELRFGPLPRWAEEKLNHASFETLQSWIPKLTGPGTLHDILS